MRSYLGLEPKAAGSTGQPSASRESKIPIVEMLEAGMRSRLGLKPKAAGGADQPDASLEELQQFIDASEKDEQRLRKLSVPYREDYGSYREDYD